MSGFAVAGSSFRTTLSRYRRSHGIWILLLIAPVGARFFIPRGDGTAVVIAVAERLPVMTSAVVGVCLGLVVSTLMLPAAYVYLRVNATRRQPWQVEEVTPASRVCIALGRFAADVSVLLVALMALTVAGCFLAWLIVPAGTLEVFELTLALWVIAGPALMLVAGLRILFDALPVLRGALGDLAFFLVWTATLPSLETSGETGFLANLADPIGFVRPLIHGSGLVDPGFTIGSGEVKAGAIPIDAMAGIMSAGYLPSRAAWAAIAVLLASLAGLLYQPHRPQRQSRVAARLRRLLPADVPKTALSSADPARKSSSTLLGIFISELRLIGSGRGAQLTAALSAFVGGFGDWRAAGLPLALLWLVFVLSARAGSNEERGLRPLRSTLPTGATQRRFAFIAAGTAWLIVLSLPRVLLRMDPAALLLAGQLGALTAATAAILAAISGSSFAPRLVLLIGWYVYVSA